MHIQRSIDAVFSGEYGGVSPLYGTAQGAGFRRLFPWSGVSPDMPWGSGLMVLAPSQSSRPHDHHEFETFFIVSGRASIRIGDEVSEVKKGDVVFVPLDKVHELTNLSDSQPFEYLCTWWDPK